MHYSCFFLFFFCCCSFEGVHAPKHVMPLRKENQDSSQQPPRSGSIPAMLPKPPLTQLVKVVGKVYSLKCRYVPGVQSLAQWAARELSHVSVDPWEREHWVEGSRPQLTTVEKWRVCSLFFLYSGSFFNTCCLLIPIRIWLNNWGSETDLFYYMVTYFPFDGRRKSHHGLIYFFFNKETAMIILHFCVSSLLSLVPEHHWGNVHIRNK